MKHAYIAPTIESFSTDELKEYIAISNTCSTSYMCSTVYRG